VGISDALLLLLGEDMLVGIMLFQPSVVAWDCDFSKLGLIVGETDVGFGDVVLLDSRFAGSDTMEGSGVGKEVPSDDDVAVGTGTTGLLGTIVSDIPA
jgi:hypothetical protein